MYNKTSSGQRWAFSAALITLGILIRVTKSFKCSITSDTSVRCLKANQDRGHTFLGFVLAVENRELCEDTHLHNVECRI